MTKKLKIVKKKPSKKISKFTTKLEIYKNLENKLEIYSYFKPGFFSPIFAKLKQISKLNSKIRQFWENMWQKMQFFTIKPRIFPSKLKSFLAKLKNPANPFVGVAEKSVKKSL